MKRIAIILFLLIVIGFLYTRYVHVASVNAGQPTNPNFVSKQEMSNVLQSNLDILWNEINGVKDQLNTTKGDVQEINGRLDNIEQDISEIKSLLSQ